MKKQDITVVTSGGRKLTRHAKGKTQRVLADSVIDTLSDKKDKQFMGGISKGTKLDFPDKTVYHNKYLKKGVHAQTFLKNCNLRFKKSEHIDIMCMKKSGYTTAEMEAALVTSPSNLKNLKKEIFEILHVTSYAQALHELD